MTYGYGNLAQKILPFNIFVLFFIQTTLLILETYPIYIVWLCNGTLINSIFKKIIYSIELEFNIVEHIMNFSITKNIDLKTSNILFPKYKIIKYRIHVNVILKSKVFLKKKKSLSVVFGNIHDQFYIYMDAFAYL